MRNRMKGALLGAAASAPGTGAVVSVRKEARMKRARSRIKLALGAAVAVIAVAAPATASADVLNDWNVIAQGQTIALRPTAHGQTRGIAMVQGAVYDAVNA